MSGTKTIYSDFVLKSQKFFEHRGCIYTIFEKREMPHDCSFVQDKVSKSKQGVIRGFHGDNKTWKLITCLHGKIKLVTYNVDTNTKRIYFLGGDDEEFQSVLVPPRTLNAHQCLSKECVFHYKWSEYYTSPEDQWSVHYNDADIDPQWEKEYEEIVSTRDKKSQSLRELRRNVKS